ncbi:MAG: Transposase IS66 family protein [Bacteroidetes bacterium ADurb.Bin234]|nr:MAG: Transposase IS66 family protein [Bacteroidetes bacterium ADurb.Bin234]
MKKADTWGYKMTIAMLQKQNKDLRIRLSNLTVKHEISEALLQERINVLLGEHKKKDDLIKMLQQSLVSQDKKINELEESASEKDKKIKRLTDEIEALRDQRDKLKTMFKKDSSNSSKPPSTDGFRKAKAASTRQKSGKKLGGQFGHPGHTAQFFQEPTEIIEKKPEPICSCGGSVNCSDDYIPKQVVDIKVVMDVKEERVFSGRCERCGKIHQGKFSEEFVNPVQYGSNAKTLAAILNSYGNVPINKTADILKGISNGALNISEGTIVNFQKSLAEKIQQPLEIIKQQLIQCKVLGADETGCRVNGDLNWMQIYSNSQYTLFGVNKKRGDFYVDGMDILDLFSGILVHDHFKSFYGYKLITHAECNAHILRYLLAVIEVMKHPWAIDMAEFFREANKLKKQYLFLEKSYIDENELNALSNRYDEILKAGETQYKAAIENKKNISYYNDERLLLKRLGEYKEEHLRFLTNFDVPFDNNGSERGARFLKGKLKVAGCFRSKEGAENYAKIASLISTLRKQGTNVYLTINNIFNGILPTFDSNSSSNTG